MVRIGHPPRTSLSHRAWRWADTVCRYATNLMLALAIAGAYVS